MGLSRTRVGGEILCAGGGKVHEARISASSRSRRYSNEAHFDRFGRKAAMGVRSPVGPSLAKKRNTGGLDERPESDEQRTLECPVWMAPALQGVFEGLAAKSGTVLCPAC